MAEDEEFEGLTGLYCDLVTFSNENLSVLDRLLVEFAHRVQEFRNLLDKPPKSDKSRQAINLGKIDIDEVEYSLNEEFKQETIKLADTLDLDEIQSAKLLLSAQQDLQDLDRTPYTCAVIRFHKRREWLLECWRLILKHCFNEDIDEDARTKLSLHIQNVAGVAGGQVHNGRQYWNKCLASMSNIDKWIHQLAERLQSASVVGQLPSAELLEVIEYQRASLTRQHGSLAAICSHMTKLADPNSDSLRSLISTLKPLDRHDMLLVHYIPVTISLIGHICSSEGACTLRDLRTLNQAIITAKDNNAWGLRNFYAATVVWWLAEYSGRYIDNSVGSPLQGVDLEKEAEERSGIFMDALRDGAFHFMLSVSQDIKPTRWYDPAKAGLLSYLLQDVNGLPTDATPRSDFFPTLLMDQFQSFVDAFITNMPDTLRKLKVEEDEQRRLLHSRFQRGPMEYELHLERFLLIIAFAFDDSPDAATQFWADKEGNLYGFLQWVAKRQPTPRVAAFCEMLKSISFGRECAESAHKFLLDEGAYTSARHRRSSSLSYNQILSELQLYSSGSKDKGTVRQGTGYNASQNPAEPLTEPESAIMLESYLRLVAHLCRESLTVRTWFLTNSSFNLPNVLFSLSKESTDGRLRAGAFRVLSALLTEKTRTTGEVMWNSLDSWVYTAFSVNPQQGTIPGVVTRSEDYVWELISSGFDEPNAFVELLCALMSPYGDDEFLSGALPFPENTGASHRMPGIVKYIDFILGRVFARKATELQDVLQLQIINWNCLNFISLCLSTFQEDLVIMANQSTTAASGKDASPFSTYIRLHPFARVMEWLFNDKVLAVLFATANQDIEQISSEADENSPLMRSLLESLNVMDLLMSLQSTYVDIVRPLVKQQSTDRTTLISNPALASFEDAVLNNLQLVVNLGLYCSAGHQNLAIVSLNLLRKLSSSRKLAVSPVAGFGYRSDRSKIIAVLEKDNEAERIARFLISSMQLDERELEVGPEAPGYTIKTHIMDFLNSCLAALPNRPTIAHLLLGFSCAGNSIDAPEEGLFAEANALFHSIMFLSCHYPWADGISVLSWLTGLRKAAMDVLNQLWKSPLSASKTMMELRTADFLFVQATKQVVVDGQTLWDGKVISDPAFIYSASAVAFQNFLQLRSAFYDYTSRELRATANAGMPTSRIQSMLLGQTVLNNGEQLQNPTIFDFFDFIELEPQESPSDPGRRYFDSLDFSICREDGIYNIDYATKLLLTRVGELKKSNGIPTSSDEERVQAEFEAILTWLHGENNAQQIRLLQADILKSWARLVTITLESCEFEGTLRMSFVLQALQITLPKFEKACSQDVTTAIELAGLSKTLLQYTELDLAKLDKSKTTDIAQDRLLHLFRVSLLGIFSPATTPALREICYHICYKYLQSTLKVAEKGSTLRRHMLKLVRSGGDRLIDVLCDDAYVGQGLCKVSALLMIDALVALAVKEDSKYMIGSFDRLNFLSVLIDNIKHIPTELRSTPASEIRLLLSYYDASLALLLRVAQTRLGASHVLNAGLFQAVRDSRIFATDPDIGLEIDNPDALKKYFDLMLSVIRVINSVVLSQGQQNDQTLFVAREFLKENRPCMVAVFKRSAGVGGVQIDSKLDLSELVDQFTLLISATGFLEFEEESFSKKESMHLFS